MRVLERPYLSRLLVGIWLWRREALRASAGGLTSTTGRFVLLTAALLPASSAPLLLESILTDGTLGGADSVDLDSRLDESHKN